MPSDGVGQNLLEVACRDPQPTVLLPHLDKMLSTEIVEGGDWKPDLSRQQLKPERQRVQAALHF